jgi:Na+/H+-dicarboxylate symporter
MIITVMIFCTVVTGIAGMRDLRKVGRVGGKAPSISKSSRRSRWWLG